jgi:hypothetical protein
MRVKGGGSGDSIEKEKEKEKEKERIGESISLFHECGVSLVVKNHGAKPRAIDEHCIISLGVR